MKAPFHLIQLACFLGRSFSGFAASIADRDWVKYPAVVQLDAGSEIFAIGDVHSDYTRLVLAINAAGLIVGVPKKPEDVQWSAGNAALVVTGDMIDKGPRALDVLRLLRSRGPGPYRKADALSFWREIMKPNFSPSQRLRKGKSSPHSSRR